MFADLATYEWSVVDADDLQAEVSDFDCLIRKTVPVNRFSQGISTTRTANEEETEETKAMTDQNPARGYDQESLEFLLQRLQKGSYAPLSIQEIEAELKRRAVLARKARVTRQEIEAELKRLYKTSPKE